MFTSTFHLTSSRTSQQFCLGLPMPKQHFGRAPVVQDDQATPHAPCRGCLCILEQSGPTHISLACYRQCMTDQHSHASVCLHSGRSVCLTPDKAFCQRLASLLAVERLSFCDAVSTTHCIFCKQPAENELPSGLSDEGRESRSASPYSGALESSLGDGPSAWRDGTS